MKKETWKSVPGYEAHYEVSSLGRVRSLVLFAGKRLVDRKTPRLRGTYLSKGGYVKTDLHKNNKSRTEYIHRLVALAFYGEPAAGQEVAHLNGVRTDNRVENLRWVSRAENHSHKALHGTHSAGEANKQARLTAADVLEMRSKYRAGQSYRSLAKEYGLSNPYAHKVVSGKAWAHLK